jgi:hypothetical protein
MPRKTPSTANAVPLPREGGLGDIAHNGVCGNNFNITNTNFSVFGKNAVNFLKKQLKKFRFWKNILKIY